MLVRNSWTPRFLRLRLAEVLVQQVQGVHFFRSLRVVHLPALRVVSTRPERGGDFSTADRPTSTGTTCSRDGRDERCSRWASTLGRDSANDIKSQMITPCYMIIKSKSPSYSISRKDREESCISHSNASMVWTDTTTTVSQIRTTMKPKFSDARGGWNSSRRPDCSESGRNTKFRSARMGVETRDRTRLSKDGGDDVGVVGVPRKSQRTHSTIVQTRTGPKISRSHCIDSAEKCHSTVCS